MISRDSFASLTRTVAVALAVSASVADAQDATAASVRGRVMGTGGTPISGAMVRLRSGDSLRTADSGAFVFRGVRPGGERLSVQAIGYAPRLIDIRIVADSGWSGTVLLERILVELPEVQVSAKTKPAEFAYTTKYDEYFRRRQMGQGSFWTMEELRARGVHDIVSIFQGIPGVSATLTQTQLSEPELRLRIARCPGSPPRLVIYLDGSQMLAKFRNGVQLAEALTSIPFNRILFVEFYRGVGQLPSDIDRGDYCAALLIWTR